MKKNIIAGNWKMNLLKDDALKLARDIKEKHQNTGDTEVVLCPPFIHISNIYNEINSSSIACGGQDCHFENSGAYTGDISSAMLKDCGCEFVILGHSERRQYHNETDELIQKKAGTAIENGLKVILCVGETLEEREAGKENEVVNSQLKNSIPENANSENLIIGYEPVWAIGTGKTPTNDEIENIHSEIKKFGFKTIYGGSVKPSNAKEILALPSVDGALVGGASLNAEDFIEIIKAVQV